jgi:hypothetical protein
MKKRLIFLIVALVIASMANSAFAYYWDPPDPPGDGRWGNPENWGPDPPIGPRKVPDGDQEIDVYGSTTNITLDDSQVFSCWYSNRARIYGGAILNIVDGGTIQGMGWLRVGENSRPGVSYVNQSGGAMIFENGPTTAYKDPAGLTLGDVGAGQTSMGVYNMSGGTLTFIHPELNTGRQAGNIRLGDRQGEGTFHVTGSTSTIIMRALDIGGRNDKDETRSARGNLVYTLDADGVSAIDVNYVDVHTYIASVSHLVVEIGETVTLDNPYDVIVLVNNRGTGAVHGLFDTCNGGSAAEGAEVDLGDGVVRSLTYVYADGVDAIGNDIALISYGDFSGDGIVDMNDLPDFLNFWLVEDEIVDINGDGLINFYEFSVFANNWRK